MSQLEMKLAAETAFITPSWLPCLPDAGGVRRRPAFPIRLHPVCSSRKSRRPFTGNGGGFFRRGAACLTAARQIFGMLDNADFPFPTIKVEGKPVEVTHGAFLRNAARDPDRRVRKAAFRAYKAYIGLINTITATYVAKRGQGRFHCPRSEV